MVKYHLTTDAVSFSNSRRSLVGMKLGSPELVSRGNGKSGSISLKDLRGRPPRNRCRQTVKAFRYFTVKLGPWCREILSIMWPSLVSSWSLLETFDFAKMVREIILPYRRKTARNSSEFRSDTIYDVSVMELFRNFKFLKFIFIESYILWFLPKEG